MHLPLILFFLSIFPCSLAVTASSCGPGSFFTGKACRPCPSGTYQYRKGKTNCTPCPPGTYFPFKGGPGRDVCLPCPAGTFSKANGATSIKSCKPCPKGTSSAPYSSKCISCPKGSIVAVCAHFQSIVNGLCQDCIKDQCFHNEPEPKCLECPEFHAAMKPNSKVCKFCPRDSRSPVGASKCTKCPKRGCLGCQNFNVYDPAFVYDEVFELGDMIRSDGCRPCPAGQVGNKEVNATRCLPCPAGTFKKDDQDGPCTPCSAGDASCVQCNKQQRYNKKNNTCVTCPRNHESAGGQATKCTRCSDNAKSTRDGCEKICPAGTEGPDFFKKCVPCFDGYIAPKAGTPEGFCTPCPIGKLPNAERTKCVRCPRGMKVLDNRCVSLITSCAQGEVRKNVYEQLSYQWFENFTCKKN